MRFIISGPIPWLLPGVLVSLVIGLIVCRWLGRRLKVHPAVALLLIVGFGLVVSTTLTPLRDAIDDGAIGTGVCDFSRWWPVSPLTWFRLSDPTLNIILFVPLGLAVGLLPPSRTKTVLVVGVLALPFIVESVQLLAPILARGCQSADAIDNLTGAVLGLVMGTVIGRASALPPGTDGGNPEDGRSDGGDPPPDR